MIIKATRISTSSGAGAVASHVLRGEKNEEIRLLQGSESEMHAAMRDAAAHGAKFGLRHFKISPQSEMTSDNAREMLRDLSREFGFDADRATLIEHQKPRAGGAGFDRHWHALAPEYDPVRGKVLDSSWMRPRHEKIARIAEERLGHETVPGRWNAAVQRQLEAEGRHDVAQRLHAHTATERPVSGYQTAAHQMTQRKGHELPDDRLAIKSAWERSDNSEAFQAALKEQGISIRQGEKPGIYIAERGEDFLGAVHRLVGEKARDVAQRLEATAPEPEPPQPTLPESKAATPPESEKPAPNEPEAEKPVEPREAAKIEPNKLALEANAEAKSNIDTLGKGPSGLPPAPRTGGGGGGAAASAESPTSAADSVSTDPTAGIEPPRPGDLRGEIEYREKVARKAQQIADRAAAKGIARAQKPAQKTGGGNVSSTNNDADLRIQEQTREAIERIARDFREAIERARAAHEIREATERFRRDIEAADRSIFDGTYRPIATRETDRRAADEATRIAEQSGPEFDELVNARNGGDNRPALAASLDDRAERERGTEPNPGVDRGGHSTGREPDSDRAKARQAFTDAAAQTRLDIALRAQPDAMQRLCAVTENLKGLDIPKLSKSERYTASREIHERLRGQFEAEKSDRYERLERRFEATKLASTDMREALARHRGKHFADIREPAKAAQTERYAALKGAREALKNWTFDQFLGREKRKDPEAHALLDYRKEQRETRAAAEQRMAQDADRIARILATNPAPDPADRDPVERGKAAVTQLLDAHTEAHERADRLAAELASARKNRNLLFKLFGFENRETLNLQAQLEQAQDAPAMHLPGGAKKDARDHGANLALAAQHSHQQWKERPEVAQVLEDARLNNVAQTLAQTDKHIAKALKDGEPEKAREAVRERERREKEQQEREAQKLRNLLQIAPSFPDPDWKK